MKKLRWQLVIILLTGLVVGILLITQQPKAVQPVQSPEPSVGGVYTEGLIGSMQRLNPLLDRNNGPDRDIDRLLFSGLVTFDSRGLPQPDLADKWGVSQDGTIYNFTLKPGALWHDGEPVTAEDVLFTIELLRAADGLVSPDLQTFWKDVDVVVLSDTDLQFRLPEPFAPFLDYLSFGILPQHILGEVTAQELVDDPFNLQPVGSGPYRFDRLIVENDQIQGVALAAFEQYYGQKPFIEQVVFKYYPDAPAAYQAYKDGEITGISNVTGDILTKVLAEPNLSIYTGRQPELSLILFNLKSEEAPFLKDKAVRRALLVGLNRQFIVDSLLKGQAIVADGPLFPGTWAYYNELKRVSFDPEEAKKLLKDAGYVFPAEGEPVRVKDEVPMALTLLYPDEPIYAAIAQEISKNWTALGLKVELVPAAYETLIGERLDQRNYQAALVNLNLMRSPDPDPYPFWDQAMATGGQNYTQWDDRNASEFLEEARISANLQERERLYRNFQLIFVEEYPALPLFYPVYTYAVDREVQGVQMGPLFDTSDRFATVSQWFLVSKPASAGAALDPSPTAAP